MPPTWTRRSTTAFACWASWWGRIGRTSSVCTVKDRLSNTHQWCARRRGTGDRDVSSRCRLSEFRWAMHRLAVGPQKLSVGGAPLLRPVELPAPARPRASVRWCWRPTLLRGEVDRLRRFRLGDRRAAVARGVDVEILELALAVVGAVGPRPCRARSSRSRGVAGRAVVGP